jgi:hypothetical protein
VLVCPHNRGVDHGVFIIGILRQVLKHSLPYPALCPSTEASVNDAKIAKSCWQVSPGNACPVTVQHGFDKQPIVFCGYAHIPFASWQQVFDSFPLVIA